jgi:hypothetical protein
MPHIRLTKKLALVMNGVDVTSSTVGDVLDVDEERAELMIASGWAEWVESPFAVEGRSSRKQQSG